MSVSIETWAGYDQDGNEINRYTATDANTDINPAEVKAAIEKVKTSCDDEMKKITYKLNGLTDNALKAMRVENMTLSDFIVAISDVINNFGSEIAKILEPLINEAEKEHDRLQTIYNQEAEDKSASGSASHKQV